MTTPTTQSQENVIRTLGLETSGARISRWKRWLLWGGGAALALAVIWFIWGGKGKTDGARYVTQPARRGDLVVTVSATGTLQPIKKVDVGIEVSGTIKTVAVDYNDKVTNGQVLARLDTTRLEVQALQSEAALAAARAKVAQTEASVQEAAAQAARLSRVFELSGGKLPSQADLDAAKATLARARADEASARAAVTQGQATLDVNRTDLAKAVIHSPINGVVLTRAVEPGQTVAAAFQAPILFTLAEDLTQMELQVDVDEADVGQVREGQTATFTVDAYPDRVFPARLTQVRLGSQTVEGVVTYKTVLQVDNAEFLLRPGMTATAVITVNRRTNALLIPNAALRFVPPAAPAGKAGGGGGLLSALLPHPPRTEVRQPEDANGKVRGQKVWTLRNGELTPLAIVKGVSDGVLTEVTGDAVEPGLELVTDAITVK